MYEDTDEVAPARDPRRTTRSSFAQAAVNERFSKAVDQPVAENHGPLDDINQSLTNLIDRVRGIRNVLSEHADRITGAIPENTSGNASAPGNPYGGKIGDLFYQVELLRSVIDDLEHETVRNTRLG